jgi:hypothetical protein
MESRWGGLKNQKKQILYEFIPVKSGFNDCSHRLSANSYPFSIFAQKVIFRPFMILLISSFQKESTSISN